MRTTSWWRDVFPRRGIYEFHRVFQLGRPTTAGSRNSRVRRRKRMKKTRLTTRVLRAVSFRVFHYSISVRGCRTALDDTFFDVVDSFTTRCTEKTNLVTSSTLGFFGKWRIDKTPSRVRVMCYFTTIVFTRRVRLCVSPHSGVQRCFPVE